MVRPRFTSSFHGNWELVATFDPENDDQIGNQGAAIGKSLVDFP